MSQTVLIFEVMWVLTTRSIRNTFSIAFIPVFIILKSQEGSLMSFC